MTAAKRGALRKSIKTIFGWERRIPYSSTMGISGKKNIHLILPYFLFSKVRIRAFGQRHKTDSTGCGIKIGIESQKSKVFRVPQFMMFSKTANPGSGPRRIKGLVYTTQTPIPIPPKTWILEKGQRDVISPDGTILIGCSGIDKWKHTPKGELQYSYRIDGNEWSPFSNDCIDL